MKNFVKLAAISAAVLFFSACTKSDAPETVANKFLKHLQKKEYTEAKKLGTEATAQMIDMIESFSKMGGENAEEEKETKIEDLKCEIDGETAICTYMEDGEERQLELVKEDGKWLVDMKKEMPMTDEEGIEMEESDSMAMEADQPMEEMTEEEME